VSEEKDDLIFIEQGKVNPNLLTDCVYEHCHCISRSDLSINPSLKFFIPYYLSAQLFVISSITLSADEGHCLDTAANCT
jgi:hypothetical protein